MVRRAKAPEPRDVTNRDGLTIGVRYDAAKHKTFLTVRCNGKILDRVGFAGDISEDRFRLNRILADIKREFGAICK
jgi:hypothetical protein